MTTRQKAFVWARNIDRAEHSDEKSVAVQLLWVQYV